MDKATLYPLIDKYLDGTVDAKEKALLEEYYNRLEKNGRVNLSAEEKLALKEEMYHHIRSGNIETIVVPLYKRPLFKVAAAVFVLLITGYSLLVIRKTDGGMQKIALAQQNDVKPPDATRATLRLSDGRTIYLDSTANGKLALESNVNVIKTADGQIAYEVASSTAPIDEIKYNIISNPRGSKVQPVILSDGTKVWLNAASSLTYPISFADNERKVSITGEAYFEVAPSAFPGRGGKRPFLVEKGDIQVTVLGTHFNVNAYDDEKDIKVSLLEGSVRASNNRGSVILKPGQQARITANLEPQISNNIDVEHVMAWKNGLFSFKNSDLPAVMRQVSRWYDVDVIYEGSVPARLFGGEISRMNNVSKVLKVLEESQVSFRIEGSKIVVLK